MKTFLFALACGLLGIAAVGLIGLVYAQPVENWQSVPSHAVNGEVELDVPIDIPEAEETPWYKPFSDSIPNLSNASIRFDIKNVTGGLTFKNDTGTNTFLFDPQNGSLWKSLVHLTVDNQTFSKPFILDLDAQYVHDLGDGFKLYWTDQGILSIGNNVWSPVSGGVYSTSAGDPYWLYIFSYVDHIPDQTNN